MSQLRFEHVAGDCEVGELPTQTTVAGRSQLVG
jgi:hypothetical protein